MIRTSALARTGVLLVALLHTPCVLRAQGSVCIVDGQPAQCAASRDEIALARKTVETYLHGLKFNDVESFKAAFWPDAKLYFLKNDKSLGQLSQADWYKGFAGSAGKEEARN